ncbi:hypothetical protein DPMN_119780 [Dreissena polymorpha]|uniref:SWIM-type domain-containing protein n=1 Tax=Dreissena polymorpha TaxID=45954 RepID=A0A9D4JS83_DREPO|nr:hypothetical protein DPMN_119780 [Dreissena polymorpha]
MKCKVTPSMSINSKCYNVWAVIEKNVPGRSGGKVLSAYCTCTAGMFGTCNHVAGLLFRIEHAVKTGETEFQKPASNQCGMCQKESQCYRW